MSAAESESEKVGKPVSETALDERIAAEEHRLDKLKRLWELKRRCASLEFCCAQCSYDIVDLRKVVVHVVCQHFKVSPSELFRRDRHARVAWPRFVAMRLLVELGGGSTEKVAQFFGLDHGSVSYGRKQIRNRCQTEPAFQALYTAIEADVVDVLGGANGEGANGPPSLRSGAASEEPHPIASIVNRQS